MMATVYSSRLLELLSAIARAMEKNKLDYAIGGAVAMAAYGYARNTSDIDLFVNGEQKPKVLAALRKLGLDIVPVFRGAHYLAQVPGVSIGKLSVDVLFPDQDPDWSAVQLPETVRVDRVRFEAFPLSLLFLAKAQAVLDGGDTEKKHEHDLRHLLQEGLIDEREVLRMAKRMKMLGAVRGLIKVLLES